jgi:flagellar basal body P-ring protein FlgI
MSFWKIILLISALTASAISNADRIKDLTEVAGVRSNQLPLKH